MKHNWWNFLNDAKIDWTSNIHLLMLIVPVIGLFLIFLFRRPLSRIDKGIQRFIFGTLGGLILAFEFAQDITKIIANAQGETYGEAVKHQVLEMLELCRLNTILLGFFLVFNKISWIKWIAGTTLFGGISTIYDHWGTGGPHKEAQTWGVIKHGVVLTLVPALAIASYSEKFTLKNLAYAHLFNYAYVALVVTLNYTVPMNDGSMTRSIGNLNETTLSDNAIAGWAPFGTRILIYVLCVTLIFWIWWGIENLIHRYTDYSRKLRFDKVLVMYFNNTFTRKTKIKKEGK